MYTRCLFAAPRWYSNREVAETAISCPESEAIRKHFARVLAQTYTGSGEKTSK